MPLQRIADAEPSLGRDLLKDAHRLGRSREFDRFLGDRFVLQAIGDHQFPLGVAASVDHRLALRRRVGHRLFAQHMLACLSCANRVLGMHAVRQDDVDHVDGGILLDRVEVVVVVDILKIDAVFGCLFLRFWGVAADQGDRAG